MIAAAMVAFAALLLTACAEFDYAGSGRGGPPAGYAGEPPTVYRVDRGDTLYSISWRYGLDHRTVARWNRIDPPYTIYPGQKLRLRRPPSGRAPTRTAETPDPAPREPAPKRRPEPVISDGADWVWPVKGRVVVPWKPDRVGKRGITIAGSGGDAIRASRGGRVVYSGNGLRGYGNLIIIKHDGRFLTAYGYNRELLVGEGERVRVGQTIARMGMASNGTPGVHFEIRRDGKPVDPTRYLPAR